MSFEIRETHYTWVISVMRTDTAAQFPLLVLVGPSEGSVIEITGLLRLNKIWLLFLAVSRLKSDTA